MPVKSKGRKPRNPKTKPWFPHRTGYWAAKVAGKLVYLGRWAASAAEVQAKYEEVLEAAQKRAEPLCENRRDVLTIQRLCNLFLHSRRQDVESGDLAQVSWRNYQNELSWFVEEAGKVELEQLKPADFSKLNQKLKHRYKFKEHERRVATLRMAVNWAVKNGYLDRLPVYGTEFKAPGKRRYRKERAEKPNKLFSARELRALVAAADDRMRALILLGINCAYLQSDLAALQLGQAGSGRDCMVLTGDGFIRFDRPKTGERRKCTLWPETVQAIHAVRGERQAGLLFRTRRGHPLVHYSENEKSGRLVIAKTDAIAKPFRALCEAQSAHKSGRGFSALRSTFETRALQVKGLAGSDLIAVNWIMGHTLGGGGVSKMADTYVQDIDLASLKRVTDGVRDWYLNSDG